MADRKKKRADPTAGEGWGSYLARFINPFSMPPGSTEEGPSLRDVIVPPASTTPAPAPPSFGQFLNPFSMPPGMEAEAEERRRLQALIAQGRI